MASVGHITLENTKKYLEEHHAKIYECIYLTREAPPFRVREDVTYEIGKRNI